MFTIYYNCNYYASERGGDLLGRAAREIAGNESLS
jgi:hypothetical protein